MSGWKVNERARVQGRREIEVGGGKDKEVTTWLNLGSVGNQLSFYPGLFFPIIYYILCTFFFFKSQAISAHL